MPLGLLPQLAPADFEGTIPAWRERKIAALLEELPRAQRRELGDVEELAPQLAARSNPQLAFSSGLSRALFELTGVAVPEESFRPEAIPAYLRFNFRVIGESERALGESRDLAELLEQHAGKAREALRRAAPPPDLERSDVVAWDFDELPRFVTRRVHGVELRSFPALVDCQKSVAVRLFEAQPLADAAHREGVRRLLQFAAKAPLAGLAKRVPAPFTRRPGLPAPRAEVEAFRELVLGRVVSDAFELHDDKSLPWSRVDFERVLARGLSRLQAVFDATRRAIEATDVELEKTQRALDGAAKHPSGTAAAADIRLQLEQLFPGDLLLHVDAARLAQFPRYLRAAQARLSRAIQEPRKDASKAEPFVPLWRTFLEKRAGVRDQDAARRLHFVLEELRVALFAPELKPAQAVSIASVRLALQALR
ncbi:MAG: DUF3418 domain-containing protein [Polyangiaceae bacterium]